MFTIYTSKLFDIIAKHLLSAHSFADDTQLYVSFSPKEEDGQSSAILATERCIIDIKKWMAEDKLLLNDAKTEFLVIGTRQQLSMIDINSIKIGDADISGVVRQHTVHGGTRDQNQFYRVSLSLQL